ncbi:sulfatase [bacterium]|nr:sulfatase [bacterium]
MALPGCGFRSSKPNVVFILVDDLGWKDLGCYGSTFHETPNIDTLAAEGVRFTDAYAASPVCSPTRASILTGKHPARLHITDWIPGNDPKNRPLLGPQDEHAMRLDEVTLAESFKEAGYATGFIGKWHLGGEGFYPQDQGFDVNIAGHHAGHPASYFYPYKNRHGHWDVPDLSDGSEGEYLTDRLTDEAVGFIQSRKERPFFLYLSYYSVHTPIQPKPSLKEKYAAKKAALSPSDLPEYRKEQDAKTRLRQDHAGYASMVHAVDDGVGRVRSALKDLGLDDNTIIVFMSDNGGLSTIPTPGPASVYPLRAGKGWVYEGGIRVPMIMHWKGHIDKGKTSDIPVMSTDFYPTLLALSGLKKRPDQHCDGVDLGPILKGEGAVDRDFLVWHYPHYHGSRHRPASAIRQGKWKLIYWYEDGRTELYNLKDDIEESHDLVTTHPERAVALRIKMMEWLRSVDAQMPIRRQDTKDK